MVHSESDYGRQSAELFRLRAGEAGGLCLAPPTPIRNDSAALASAAASVATLAHEAKAVLFFAEPQLIRGITNLLARFPGRRNQRPNNTCPEFG